jgi:hypothetical protein
MEAFEDAEEGRTELKAKLEIFSCVIDGTASESNELPGKGKGDSGETEGESGGTEESAAGFAETNSWNESGENPE